MKDKIICNWEGVERPMTAKDKRKWLKALRSGKFRKGRGSLKTQAGYCCLGVANEVFELGQRNPDQRGFLYARDRPGHNYNIRSFLPDDQQALLAKINDHSRGFDKVIEAIERIVPFDPASTPIRRTSGRGFK